MLVYPRPVLVINSTTLEKHQPLGRWDISNGGMSQIFAVQSVMDWAVGAAGVINDGQWERKWPNLDGNASCSLRMTEDPITDPEKPITEIYLARRRAVV